MCKKLYKVSRKAIGVRGREKSSHQLKRLERKIRTCRSDRWDRVALALITPPRLEKGGAHTRGGAGCGQDTNYFFFLSLCYA